MSRQLALSAAFSVFALSALALSTGPALGHAPSAATQTGATIEAAAPALPKVPSLSDWASFTH